MNATLFKSSLLVFAGLLSVFAYHTTTVHAQETEEETDFDQKFWQYLKNNNYKNWSPAPGKTGDFYAGESPHGELLKIYLNRTAASNPKLLPNGSVIVKENFDADRTLTSVTVMYRSKGYYPEGNDWYWLKYNADGTTARSAAEDGAKKLRGIPKECVQCHSRAPGSDFTFFND